MIAIGFRADPGSIFWAVVQGMNAPLTLVASGKLLLPTSYVEAAALSWSRSQVKNLLKEYRPEHSAVRYPETNARTKHVVSAHKRARIEGVILEALSSDNIPVLTGPLVTMSSHLGTESAKKYVDTGEFRGLNCSEMDSNLREAVMVAAAVLSSANANFNKP
ncbi:crossover junction endodeoxyribonuclease RuvC [Fimbriiglobus ruber]|uniref:crossover junction endodeoxyribonuclease RuvC n=1 Tax=Fimbriiglobus ruber TaxID=1908690 RepID=UPI001179EE89|nr:crossover junction endodeoxyribonuclease RuvC [Fimbriiglobus ruber]